MISLYDFPNSPYCQRVRILLAEKGLSYERIPVNIKTGEQNHPDYLKLNPNGKVPTLVDRDVVVFDSAIISEYLEEKYPEPPTLPQEAVLRSKIRLWIHYCDNRFASPFNAYHRESRKPAEERNLSLMAQQLREGLPHLLYLDSALEDKDYLAGDFSLADIAFASRMLMLAKIAVPLPDVAINLKRWVGRLKNRQSVWGL